MYSISFHGIQVTCESADEVRSLLNGHYTNGSAIDIPDVVMTLKPDARGAHTKDRWRRAYRYAKEKGISPRKAFEVLTVKDK
jgi:hypothetical protein